jgi:hypothetical protein
MVARNDLPGDETMVTDYYYTPSCLTDRETAELASWRALARRQLEGPWWVQHDDEVWGTDEAGHEVSLLTCSSPLQAMLIAQLGPEGLRRTLGLA